MNYKPAPVNTSKRQSLIRKIGMAILFIVIVMQLIQPGKNNQSMDMTADISTVVKIPDTVHVLLKKACYDCHSNFTNYPWYSNIQPVGWWLKRHIDDGKKHLNFQEFALLKGRPNSEYSTPKLQQAHKLEEVLESQQDKWMPMESYVWIHKEAALTVGQRQLIIDWVGAAKAEIIGN